MRRGTLYYENDAAAGRDRGENRLERDLIPLAMQLAKPPHPTLSRGERRSQGR
jgi:hypothetical protein